MKRIKKLSLILAAAFMVVGVSMANTNRDGKRTMDPKERAEKMTEKMVKEYNLNDTQKQQLLDLNLAMTEKMGNRPSGHRHGKKGDGNVTKKDKENKGKDQVRADRNRRSRADVPRPTAEEREKRHQEMKQERENYQAQLQSIMNAEQYQAFTKKQAERDQKRQERGEKRKENRTQKPTREKGSRQV